MAKKKKTTINNTGIPFDWLFGSAEPACCENLSQVNPGHR